ncbi:T9SS type A sorting domain-containing protein [Aequorivita sinensis]|uniref:T9SS type A sorting domain-containing protein n=1 Tax=Aequorivita sinensis TaxID=1382458 RepID=UPI00230197D6|nr:T9SS type A sorting domain-containing protein [Aequorivita sinensis]
MKPLLFTLFALLNASVYAQFQEHIIESVPYIASAIISTDVDNDGDNDIIVSGGINNQLRWLENTDGLGAFTVAHSILEMPYMYAGNLAITDINGDNNVDVLITLTEQDCGDIRTFRNLGAGNFELFSISMYSCGNQTQIGIGDINGDNNNDWISSISGSEYNEPRVSWFENDGVGNVTEHLIENSFLRSFQLVDVDGDDDIDLIGFTFNGLGNTQIVWFENTDGGGDFVKHLIGVNPSLTYDSKLIAADMDNDGNMDMVIAYNNTLSWFRNEGQGNFGPEIIINSDPSFTKTNVLAVDLDSDGHIDLISSGSSNSISYYQNDGNQNFVTTTIIDNTYRPYGAIYAKDINGDNKIDIITNSSENGKIAWYENQMELSVNQNSVLDFSIYPNPVSEDFIITRSTGEPAIGNLYDMTGKLILNFSLNNQENQVNVENLASGIYFLRISNNKDILIKKIVIK